MNDDTGKKIGRCYPLSFAMRYVTAEPAGGRTGFGETVWMSGTELAFLAKGPASAGQKVAMYIEWPVLLQGEVPLQLIVTGEIAKQSGPLSVARITRHEFRTRRQQSSAIGSRQALSFSVWDKYPARQMASV